MVTFLMCQVTRSHFNKKPIILTRNRVILTRNRVISTRNRVILTRNRIISSIAQSHLRILKLTINSFLRRVKAISGPLGQNSDNVPLNNKHSFRSFCHYLTFHGYFFLFQKAKVDVLRVERGVHIDEALGRLVGGKVKINRFSVHSIP